MTQHLHFRPQVCVLVFSLFRRQSENYHIFVVKTTTTNGNKLKFIYFGDKRDVEEKVLSGRNARWLLLLSAQFCFVNLPEKKKKNISKSARWWKFVISCFLMLILRRGSGFEATKRIYLDLFNSIIAFNARYFLLIPCSDSCFVGIFITAARNMCYENVWLPMRPWRRSRIQVVCRDSTENK